MEGEKIWTVIGAPYMPMSNSEMKDVNNGKRSKHNW
jgi:hypothetical protein